MKQFLFLCVHNSCRSQIAQGWLNHLASGKAQARSAWSEPTQIDPSAIEVMNEVWVDLSMHTSKGIDALPTIEFDYIITVCNQEKEACPYIPSSHALQLHRSFPDPAGKEIEEFRKVRDQIKQFIEELLEQID